MPPLKLKTSSLQNIRRTSNGFAFKLEGQAKETVYPFNSPQGQALQSFYLAALRNLHEHQKKIADVLQKEAAKEVTPGAPDSVSSPASEGPAREGIFSRALKKIKSWVAKKEQDPEVALDDDLTHTPQFTPGLNGVIPESPMTSAPVLPGTESPSPTHFRPINSPPPGAAGATVAPTAAPSASAAVDSPVSSSPTPAATKAQDEEYPDIKEVYADESGILIEWGTGVQMRYAHDNPIAQLFMATYKEMDKSGMKVENLDAVAQAWESKSKSKGKTEWSPAASKPRNQTKSARRGPSQDGAERKSAAEDFGPSDEEMEALNQQMNQEQEEHFPEMSEPHIPDDHSAPGEVDAPLDTPPSAPTTGPIVPRLPSPAETVSAVPALAPEQIIPAATAPELTEQAKSPVAEKQSLNIINPEGSKLSISMRSSDGKTSILKDLSDIEAQYVKNAMEMDKAPLTHASVGEDGALLLHFDSADEAVDAKAWIKQQDDLAKTPPLLTPNLSVEAAPMVAPVEEDPTLPQPPVKFSPSIRNDREEV